MPEKTPEFTVTDRRKFTLEGDLRDEQAAPATEREETAAPPAPPTRPAAAQPAQPVADSSPAPKHIVDPDLEPLPDEAEDEFEDEFEEMPEVSAADSAEQHAAYRQSSQQLDDMVARANPGMKRPGAPPEMNFDQLVQSIYMTAALQLGAGTQPGEQPRVDIIGARQSIDMLNVLVEKTKGNLTDKEQRLLQNALFELRMTFLEITNAIAHSAHQQPKPGGVR